MKIFSVLLIALFFVGCASQRQKPVCAEIEYRLNHTAMSPDQRAWTAEELRQCQAEQEEYAKSDSLTNKFKKSIYEMYADSKKDSAKTDSVKINATKDSAKDSVVTSPVLQNDSTETEKIPAENVEE
ncbi:MAG: hypothetical protein SOZ02_04800 [Hallerella porci]|uniref:Lipoprotein n=1 Tax=Hallerella porci TaxID=1945871 RepID=A0ABX5LRQ6_9BACT|nr:MULTISPECIES: hypothetical protein [Hallerella]MCI5600929.1 hypothetical protein [Hallerella sp.]MDY3921468.1 hypothetical protein [Hallerella porci]PWL03968.1 hypothetical protein B0H50_102140 [Hallerella porci]